MLRVQQKKQFKEQTFWASLSRDLKGQIILGMAVDPRDCGPGPSNISDPHGKIILTVRMLNGAMLPGASPHPVHLPYSISMSTEPPSWLSLGSSSLPEGNSALDIRGLNLIIVILHSTLRSGLWLLFHFPCIFTPGVEFIDYLSANFLISSKFYFSNFCVSLLLSP